MCRLTLLTWVFCLALVLAAHCFAQEGGVRATGLVLSVEGVGWPALNLVGRPVAFGCVAIGEGGRLIEQRANEVADTLSFDPAEGGQVTLRVTVSRLTPALLLESDASKIELFAVEEQPSPSAGEPGRAAGPGSVKPLRWATPGPEGTVSTGVFGSHVSTGADASATAPEIEGSTPPQLSRPPASGLRQWLLFP